MGGAGRGSWVRYICVQGEGRRPGGGRVEVRGALVRSSKERRGVGGMRAAGQGRRASENAVRGSVVMDWREWVDERSGSAVLRERGWAAARAAAAASAPACAAAGCGARALRSSSSWRGAGGGRRGRADWRAGSPAGPAGWAGPSWGHSQGPHREGPHRSISLAMEVAASTSSPSSSAAIEEAGQGAQRGSV